MGCGGDIIRNIGKGVDSMDINFNTLIRYIGKESNNLEDNLTGLDDPDYLEYDNIEDFKQWILSLKPKDVKDKEISKQTLWNIKKRILKNEMKYKSKALKGIYKVYQERKLNN